MPRSNDYFSNHSKVRRFPWRLYHDPIESDLLSFIRRASQKEGGADVLVIGCGLMQELEHFPKSLRITAIDIDDRAVQALASAGDSRIKHCQTVDGSTDLTTLGEFDAIYAKEVIEHILTPHEYLVQLHSLLRPQGRLWLSTPNYGEPWLPLVESTFLELVARRSGFTRKGIHPTPFSRRRLANALENAGFVDVEAKTVAFRLALIGEGSKAGPVG